MQKILITGGAGFIGSHISTLLLQSNNEVVIIDNFSNSSKKVLKKIKDIVKEKYSNLFFYEFNISNETELEKIFSIHDFDSVIHLAGYKSVSESLQRPLSYYINNLSNSLPLLKIMQKFNVKNLVFSSSCAVYDHPLICPLNESHPALNPISTYGKSKLFFENILRDIYGSSYEWNIIVLRYFNPAGAHPSGVIGEFPADEIPKNLIPYITKFSQFRNYEYVFYGADFKTYDGTGVRDYVHIMDLSEGHINAIEFLMNHNNQFKVINLGYGHGVSVKEVVNTFEDFLNRDLKYLFMNRRAGDADEAYADVSYAREVLNWNPRYNLRDICKHSLNFIKKNPNGYK